MEKDERVSEKLLMLGNREIETHIVRCAHRVGAESSEHDTVDEIGPKVTDSLRLSRAIRVPNEDSLVPLLAADGVVLPGLLEDVCQDTDLRRTLRYVVTIVRTLCLVSRAESIKTERRIS